MFQEKKKTMRKRKKEKEKYSRVSNEHHAKDKFFVVHVQSLYPIFQILSSKLKKELE